MRLAASGFLLLLAAGFFYLSYFAIVSLLGDHRDSPPVVYAGMATIEISLGLLAAGGAFVLLRRG